MPQASDAGLPLSQRSYLGHVLPESLLHILEVGFHCDGKCVGEDVWIHCVGFILGASNLLMTHHQCVRVWTEGRKATRV